jgi:RNA polymerase sigma factor (sigma-70 family)
MQINYIWEKFKKGESSAFETLYSCYIDELLQYGSRFTRDISLVEDCIHDLFIRLYERRKKLTSPNSLKAYLLSSLRREILTNLKRKDVVQEQVPESEFVLDIDIEQAIIRSEIKKEQVQQVQQVLDNLSDRQREAIYLSFYNGLSNDEIAQILEINNQSVRNLLSQGIKRMKSEAQLSSILLIASLLRSV